MTDRRCAVPAFAPLSEDAGTHITRMGSILFDGTENHGKAGFDKVEADQEADGNSDNCRMEEGVDAEEDSQDTDDQLEDPPFRAELLCHRHGSIHGY